MGSGKHRVSKYLTDLLQAHNQSLSMLLNDLAKQSEASGLTSSDELAYELNSENATFWLQSTPDPAANAHNESLEFLLGPVRESDGTVMVMTIIYVLILCAGVTGNSITCLVIAKKRYMHTPTNYYLFSLAVSDLLLLILGLPQDLVYVWQRYPYAFGESFCILRGLTSELSTNASILTITAFTIERYVAICHPLRSHTTLKLSRVVKTIIVIWVIAALCATPIAYQFGIVQQHGLEGSDQCTIKRLLYPYVFEIATMVFFVLPICIITILYIFIGIRLRASSKTNRSINRAAQPRRHFLRQKSSSSSSNSHSTRFDGGLAPPPSEARSQLSMSVRRQNASRRAVIKMLVAVVFLFFVSYFGFHFQRVLAMVLERHQDASRFYSLYIIVTHVSGVTYYLSSTINPILYQVMSKKFRLALRETFSCCRRGAARDAQSADHSVAGMCATPSSKQNSLQRKHHNATHAQSDALGARLNLLQARPQKPPVFVISSNSD